jgi:hypothetical protein
VKYGVFFETGNEFLNIWTNFNFRWLISVTGVDCVLCQHTGVREGNFGDQNVAECTRTLSQLNYLRNKNIIKKFSQDIILGGSRVAQSV